MRSTPGLSAIRKLPLSSCPAPGSYLPFLPEFPEAAWPSFCGKACKQARNPSRFPFGSHSLDLDADSGKTPLKATCPASLPRAACIQERGEHELFGEWRSSDEVCKIWWCEPLNVSNAKIPKNVVNRRHRFLTNDVAKASFKSVLECQPRKCG